VLTAAKADARRLSGLLAPTSRRSATTCPTWRRRVHRTAGCYGAATSRWLTGRGGHDPSSGSALPRPRHTGKHASDG